MRYLWRVVIVLLVLSALLAIVLSPASAQEGRHVDVALLKGTVDPIMAQYIVRVIDAAVDDGASAVIIEMDTPGGLDTSMRRIISKMLASPLPVVVYISPSGARGASAGVFITIASNVAAMAPSTNIGSAHPVSSEGEDIQGEMNTKVTNDAVAYIRTIAEKRGRNADWAEQAVRKSVNITEKEALDQKVVEIIAADMRDLLNQLDGRQATTTTGAVTLKTAGIAVNRLNMNLAESILHKITDPTLAYLLLTIGIWALIAEFNNPGAILPGVTGAICLILAFVAFESLPLNWGGVLLILVSVVLFIADTQAPSHGILTAGGIIAFALGSLILFSPLTPSMPSMPTNVSVPWPWVAAMTALSAAVFTVAVGAGLRAQRTRVTVGGDMTGGTGVARSDLDPNGVVLIQSEEWTAVAVGGRIEKGARVRVVGREGLVVKVTAVGDM
jgi:membrane-bound serine protease (ClpP class)